MNQSSFLLGNVLTPETIRLNLRSNNRDDVLSELVAAMPEAAHSDDFQRTLVRALREREQLHSTGIGDGVALPHARNSLAGFVEKPVIVFGRQDQGIPFGAIDGQPSRLFFLLVAPTVTQHLAMLARISRLLRDAKLRQNLLAATTPETVLAHIRDAETRLTK